MLQHQPQEVRTADGSCRAFAGATVAIPERDLAIGAAYDVALLNHPPVQVAPQIDQRLVAIAHGLAIDHPALGQADRRRQAVSVQGRQQLAMKHPCQGFVVEQVVATLLGLAQAAPQAVFGIKGCTRHGQMHMGVKLQAPGMGMQHAHGTGQPFELAVVAGQKRVLVSGQEFGFEACNDAADIRGRFEQIEAELTTGPYFAGERFTMLDAMFGPVCRYFDLFEQFKDFGFFAHTPRVRAWRAALTARASVQGAASPGYPVSLRAFLVARKSALSNYIHHCVAT